MRSGTSVVAAVCLLFLPAASMAGAPTDWYGVDEGTPYTLTTTGEITCLELDGNYGLLAGWQDPGTGTAVAQHLDPVGDTLWGANGFQLADTGLTGPTYYANVAACADGNGGGYVAWVDDVSGSENVYVTRLRRNGDAMNLPGTAALDGGRMVFTRRLSGMLIFAAASPTVTAVHEMSGTVSRTTGSDLVTGSGATFSQEISSGDWVSIDPTDPTEYYQVASVDGDGSFRLVNSAAPDWPALSTLYVRSSDFLKELVVGDTIFSEEVGGASGEVLAVSSASITLDANYAGTDTGALARVTNQNRCYAALNLNGNIAISAGSRTVNGTASSFLLEVSPGDLIGYAALDSDLYEVKTVVSDTEIELKHAAFNGTGAVAAGINASRAQTQFLSDIKPGEFVQIQTAATGWQKVNRVFGNSLVSLLVPFDTGSAAGEGAVNPCLAYGSLTFNDLATPTVTGGNGTFTEEVSAGDFIRLDGAGFGFWAEVASVQDATLTLVDLPTGMDGTGAGTLCTSMDFKTQVGEPSDVCRSPHVVASDHGVYVVYLDRTQGIPTSDVDPGEDWVPRVMLALLSPEGVFQWRTDLEFCHPHHDGYTPGTDQDHRIRVYPDTTEGIIVVWNEPTFVNQYGDLEPATATFAARFNETGESVWGADPLMLYRRVDLLDPTQDNVASVWPDGEGGLWVTGKDWYHQTTDRAKANNGYYAIANHLGSDGVLDPEKWKQALEWDCHEVGDNYDTLPGIWDQYNTHQKYPRIVADGAGGCYVQVLDCRKFDGGFTNAYPSGPADEYLDVANPSEVPLRAWNIWAQHLTGSSLKLEWGDGSRNVANYVNSPLYIEYQPAPPDSWVYFSWYEGHAVVENNAMEKRNHSLSCHPWTRWDPIDGLVLWNPMVSVWAEPQFTTTTGTATFTLGSTTVVGQSVETPLTGTVTFETDSVLVEGVLTTFTSQVSAGDLITINAGAPSEYFTVDWVINNTNLVLTSIPLVAGAGVVAEIVTPITAFTTELDVGDLITINPGTPAEYYTIDTILHDAGLILTSPAVATGTGIISIIGGIAANELDEISQDGEIFAQSMWRLGAYNISYGNMPATGRHLFVQGTPRFGTYAGWTDAAGAAYLTHFNYYVMVESGRVPRVGEGPDIFAPPPVIDLGAQVGPGTVTLTWTNPRTTPGGRKPLRDWAGTMVRRSLSAVPASPEDGVLVYAGPERTFTDTDVVSGTTYHYAAFTFDTELAEKNYSSGSGISALVGFSDVLNFLARGIDQAIDLSWDIPGGSSSTYAGVIILRSETAFPTSADLTGMLNNGTTTFNTSVMVSGVPFSPLYTQYTDDDLTNGLVNGTPYHYTAFAFDNSTPTPTDTNPPDRPSFSEGVTSKAAPLPPVTGFVAQGLDGQVDLSWTVQTGASGYHIRRSTEDYPETHLEGDPVYYSGTNPDFPSFESTKTDNAGIVNGLTYYYSIFSYDDQFNHALPDQDYAEPAIARPASFTGTIGDRTVALTWVNDMWAGIDLADIKITIVRSTTSPGPATIDDADGVQIYPPASETAADGNTFQDTDLTNGVDYYYSIFASQLNSAGDVLSTSPALASTPSPLTPADPGPPAGINLSAQAFDGGAFHIRLSWDPPTALDVMGIMVIRRPDRDPTTTDRDNVIGDLIDLLDDVDDPDLDDGLTTIIVYEIGDGPDDFAAPLNFILDLDLVDEQTYYYAGWAFDDEPSNNFSPTSLASATAEDNFPPVLTLTVDPNSNGPLPGTADNQPDAFSANLAWTSDEGCTYVLAFGVSTGYGTTDVTPTYATAGSYAWLDLPAGSTRYYQITATDTGGEQDVITGVFTLTGAMSSVDDSDGDGLLDSWEALYWGTGGDLTTLPDVAGSDSDGWTDLEEYQMGTNPLTPDTDGDGIQDDLDPDPLSGGSAIPLAAPDDNICGASDGATLAITALLLALYGLVGRKRAVARA